MWSCGLQALPVKFGAVMKRRRYSMWLNTQPLESGRPGFKPQPGMFTTCVASTRHLTILASTSPSENGNNYRTYLLGLLWRLNKVMLLKGAWPVFSTQWMKDLGYKGHCPLPGYPETSLPDRTCRGRVGILKGIEIRFPGQPLPTRWPVNPNSPQGCSNYSPTPLKFYPISTDFKSKQYCGTFLFQS